MKGSDNMAKCKCRISNPDPYEPGDKYTAFVSDAVSCKNWNSCFVDPVDMQEKKLPKLPKSHYNNPYQIAFDEGIEY